MRLLKLILIPFGVVGGLLMVMIAAFGIADHIRERNAAKVAHLDGSMDEFVRIALAAESTGQAQTGSPTSKPIIICMSDNDNTPMTGWRRRASIDTLTLDLPRELFPNTSTEVQTIVALYWGQKQVGEYDGGGVYGMQETCRVDVIDVQSGCRIGTAEFVGGEPPTRISDNESKGSRVFGRGCNDDVMDYVITLFR